MKAENKNHVFGLKPRSRLDFGAGQSRKLPNKSLQNTGLARVWLLTTTTTMICEQTTAVRPGNVLAASLCSTVSTDFHTGIVGNNKTNTTFIRSCVRYLHTLCMLHRYGFVIFDTKPFTLRSKMYVLLAHSAGHLSSYVQGLLVNVNTLTVIS